MKFQVGDLIISKGFRNKKQIGLITEIHEQHPEDMWRDKTITIQYSADCWTRRLPICFIEKRINDTNKQARWYHYSVDG